VRVNTQFSLHSIESTRIVIKGAGDLATGVALRLHRCGFPVVMTELARPLAVRRTVSFAQAVFDGATQVEEVAARACAPGDVEGALAAGAIPVLVAPGTAELAALRPAALVDAIMAKRNPGTALVDAPLVVALGPGFTAGVDCHAAIETNRGHNLGRVIWQGSAEPDTGLPGELPGAGARAGRVLRAPADGCVAALAAIGERVAAGATIAHLHTAEGDSIPILAPFDCILRGIIHPSVTVRAGTKIGDVDPRARREFCFTVSDKSLAIGGGVLEAILAWGAQRGPRVPPV
jgi:xanthine dehydrogenase accessory factor